MGRAAERVDQYVQQGYLTTDEGETVRQLSDIDKREKSGEIDAEEASHLRNSLLSDDLCTKLERKVKGAVDHAVRFLQAFESLQRVSTSVDEGLRFLIHHKNILDSELGPRERGLAAQELLEDREMLRLVIDIMDRKDHEIRMISVCLPPYSYIVKRGNERIGNLTIEEDFVDDLRELKADDMSDKLHSDDPMVRIRPAADIRCLVAILNHLIKATPWRKEVRMLRVRATLNQPSVTICVAMATAGPTSSYEYISSVLPVRPYIAGMEASSKSPQTNEPPDASGNVSGSASGPQDGPCVAPGQCGDCRHARAVHGGHSQFYLCQRASEDDRYSRYPRLPMLDCRGAEPASDLKVNPRHRPGYHT